MTTQKLTLNEEIAKFCAELEQEFDLIPAERKAQLLSLRDYITRKFKENKTPKLVVICTHNSRRSHLGQLWLAVGADYFQLPEMQTFSGGTETTAFNIRAVVAIQRIGFEVRTEELNQDNPVYQITWKAGMKPYRAFSKKYETAPNPEKEFAAIMVCSQANKGCPLVSGCDFRLSLPYDDPKDFDDTDLESEKYDERVRQIGREVFFVLYGINRG